MLLDYPAHKQMQTYVKALNHFYLATPQLWEQDTDWRGFEWISHEDNRNNIIAFRRVAKDGSDIVVVVNFSPEEQQEYRVGVPITGTYEEIFTSDKTEFGGSGIRPASAGAPDNRAASSPGRADTPTRRTARTRRP